MKTYSLQSNIGKAKYVVSFHDGVKKHSDQSPFYDIAIFKNQKLLAIFIKALLDNDYKEI